MTVRRLARLLAAAVWVSAVLPSETPAQAERLSVVFYAVYVFEAKMDGEVLEYRWPENYTSVMVLDRMARNTAELVETLRQTYAFRQFVLLRAFSSMQVFLPDGSAVTWAGPASRGDIQIENNELGLSVNAVEAPKDDMAMLQVGVTASLTDVRRLVFKVAAVAAPGKTFVLGDQYPPSPRYGLPSGKALFVAVTTLPKVIASSEDLRQAAKLVARIRDLAPESDKRIPLSKDGLWTTLKSTAAEVLGAEVADYEPEGAVAGSEKVVKRSFLVVKVQEREAPPPLQESSGEVPIFVPYDFPPEPVGGFAAIQNNLDYPEAAVRDSIEGRVILHVLINEQGEVEDTRILKSLRKDADQAAIDAVKATRWKPALQRNMPVKLWVTVPVAFELRQAEEAPKPAEHRQVEEQGGEFFVPYDTAPEPLGGFEAIQRNLVYPDRARRAALEGRVNVHAFVNEKGEVEETRVLKSLGMGCDEAAEAAVKKVHWSPALQRGKPVGVWVAVPVVFRLRKEEAPGSAESERDRAWSTGYEFHKNGLYRQAIEPLWKVIKLDSAHVFKDRPYRLLMDCYKQVGKPDSARIVEKLGFKEGVISEGK